MFENFSFHILYMGKFGKTIFGMFTTLATCHHKMPSMKTIAMNCSSAMIWDSQGIKMKCILCSYHIKHKELVIFFTICGT